MVYATVDDITTMWRKLTLEEAEKATALIPTVGAALRLEAEKVGKDLDEMAKDPTYAAVLKSVVVDIVSRMLLASTEDAPMTQESQSALGYTWSGTYLTPGGGLFIKKAELQRLGLRRQKYGVIDMYET